MAYDHRDVSSGMGGLSITFNLNWNASNLGGCGSFDDATGNALVFFQRLTDVIIYNTVYSYRPCRKILMSWLWPTNCSTVIVQSSVTIWYYNDNIWLNDFTTDITLQAVWWTTGRQSRSWNNQINTINTNKKLNIRWETARRSTLFENVILPTESHYSTNIHTARMKLSACFLCWP